METKKEKSTFTEKQIKDGDLIQHYWRALGNLIMLLKASELKAGLILSFFGIIFNFVYQNAERLKENLDDFSFLYVLFSLWLLSTLKSIYHSVNTFIPRIEKQYDPNVFFFGDVISKFGDINQFSEAFLATTMNKKKVFDQLGQQIFINSKITAQKFKNVNASIRYLVISLVILGLIIVSQIAILFFFK